jgi:hypothetical protein
LPTQRKPDAADGVAVPEFSAQNAQAFDLGGLLLACRQLLAGDDRQGKKVVSVRHFLLNFVDSKVMNQFFLFS